MNLQYKLFMIKSARAMTIWISTLVILFSSQGNVIASETSGEGSTPSYSTVIEVKDFGATVTKLIINLGEERMVSEGSVNKNFFNVHVEKLPKHNTSKINDSSNSTDPIPIKLEDGDRTVTSAYVSDMEGNPRSFSNYITLEMKIGPTDNLGSAIYSTGETSSGWAILNHTITQLEEITAKDGSLISNLRITKSTGEVKNIVDAFNTGEFTNLDDDILLRYAEYAPANDNGKNPLIIWLHGGGEGGTDPTITISGNKASNFASDEMQSYFGGAYVLTPQAPTRWMEGFTGIGDGTSIYQHALMALIKEYVENNNDIDRNRIYIGGVSNGGYMTMLMMRDYGQFFAAAMVACEALRDDLISDDDIQRMKDYSIWFVAARSDTIVPVDQYVVPTFNRFIDAGAKDVHLTLYDKVIDQTGLYKQENGQPYEYYGHLSWIYLYNNDPTKVINGKEVTLMEWLANRTMDTTAYSSAEDEETSFMEESRGEITNNTDVVESNSSYSAPIIVLLLIIMFSAVGGYLLLKKIFI